jgi:hypothetical protein
MHVKSYPACVPGFVVEYRSLIESIGPDPSDEQLRAILVEHAEWTEQGAAVVVMLARQFGTSVLANALALAEALGIEDGDAGF